MCGGGRWLLEEEEEEKQKGVGDLRTIRGGKSDLGVAESNWET